MLPQEKEKGNVTISLLFKSLFHKRGGKTIKHPSQETVPVQRGGVWSDRSGPSAPRRLSILLPSKQFRSPGLVRIEGKDTSWVQSARGPTLLTRDPILRQLPPPGTASGWCPPYHQRVGLGTAALTRPASDTGGLSPRCASDPWVLGPDTHLGAGRKEENSRAVASLGEKDLSRDTAWGPWASLWGEDLKTWLQRKV